MCIEWDGREEGEYNLKELSPRRIHGVILAMVKNCESIEVRCASVFSVHGIGIPAGEKGQTAEVFSDSRSEDAGPMENIPRTVTKVERYHSLSDLFVPLP